MPTLIRQFPILVKRREVVVPGGTATILPFQLAVNVSLTNNKVHVLSPNTPRFPAVIDLGFNQSFLLQERHFIDWANLQRSQFKTVGRMTVFGQETPEYTAKVWVHRNAVGTHHDAPGGEPFCIQLDNGVAVSPSNLRNPRLPLLGLRTLFFGDLQLSFDWRERSSFSLLTTPWWWRFFA